MDLVLERLAAGGSRLSAITEELLDRCNAQKATLAQSWIVMEKNSQILCFMM